MLKSDSYPQLLNFHPGDYSDGHPLDTVHYLECKVILKSDRFIPIKSFLDYSALMQRAA